MFHKHILFPLNPVGLSKLLLNGVAMVTMVLLISHGDNTIICFIVIVLNDGGHIVFLCLSVCLSVCQL